MSEKTPIYLQVKNDIKTKILSKKLLPGQVLPSEKDYCAQYSVSRMTIRQALGELQNEGLIYSVKGKGTLVSRPKVEQYLSKLTSFSVDMQKRGFVPGSIVLETAVVKATLELAEYLQVGAGAELFYIARLRTADGTPMAIERGYFNQRITGDLLAADFNNQSLYEYLVQKRNVQLSHASQSLETISASKRDAEILQISESVPCMLMKRQTFTGSNQVVEYTESVYIGSRYKFYVEMTV